MASSRTIQPSPIITCISSSETVQQERSNLAAENMALTSPLLRRLPITAARVSDTDRQTARAPSDPQDRAQGIAEMFAEAHRNSPQSEGVRLVWMTIGQCAATLQISKKVLSTWARRGYIASVKGDGANDHRYLNLNQVLHFLADRMMAQDHHDAATPSTDASNRAH